jgi:hypothetical protein
MVKLKVLAPVVEEFFPSDEAALASPIADSY